MMDWGEIQFMGFWMIGFWLILFVIAVIVHKDAEKHGMDGLIWFILIIIPVIGYIFLIIYLIFRNENNSGERRTSSQEILDERYAKGEITREEYQQKKEDIKTRK